MDQIQVGSKIRKIRGLKGVSQEYLASKLGISQAAIVKIENDEIEMTLDRLLQISKLLDVSYRDILEFDESKVLNANFNENSTNNGTVFNLIEKEFENERALYERIIKTKDDEIARLIDQINRFNSK